ncbi:hypothetical protein [Streptomyces griseorubiginosus]|uniref:hypothetical protein n=1 Tax=Streptomyces griseorubiginosus TaxID=67304 RepID=UPI0011406D7F
MGEITYTRGDATAPSVKGVKLIAHVCNDIGGWGGGSTDPGHVTRPEGARGTARPATAGLRPNTYRGGTARVALPRSAKWSRVEPLVMARLVERGIAVTVYDFGQDSAATRTPS